MANVSIKFNNKEFLLSCEDGQEEHLEELLIQINQKFNDLKKKTDCINNKSKDILHKLKLKKAVQNAKHYKTDRDTL